MFLQLFRGAGGLDNDPYNAASPGQAFLEMHPDDLANMVDDQWGQRDRATVPDTTHVHALPIHENPAGTYLPDHLIYAYLIENTRIFEILEKVIFEFAHGERLGFPQTPGTYQWLRAAEEVFYRNDGNYLIHSTTSNVRPDIRAQRRNAYYRMFAMDLNHGGGGSAGYPYHKPASANRDFVPLFEEFLSEVWIAMTNLLNFGGMNPTDVDKMNFLINQLHIMLTTRKQHGLLYREEFYSVATMSWMHLTLLVDNAPVVRDLGIAAQSPAERLKQMGERVGLPAHPKADAFFRMAESAATILSAIELVPGLVAAPFFIPGAAYTNDANILITQWSIATGRDLKARRVSTVPQTTPPPRPLPIPAVKGNGVPVN